MGSMLGRIKVAITDADRHRAEKQYFVGHPFTREKIDDLRRIVDGVFGPLGLQPYYADRELMQEHILSKIVAKILLTKFGVFDVSGLNPNVMMELGVAVALGRPCLVIVDEATPRPPWLQPYVSIRYSSLGMLTEKLSQVAGGYADEAEVSPLVQPLELRKVEQILAHAPHSQGRPVLIFDEGLPAAGDFRQALQNALHGFEVEATYLDAVVAADSALRTTMDQVSGARCCVFHITGSAPALVYLALGLAFGFERSSFLVARRRTAMPSNLAGLDRLEYESYSQLEREFTDKTRYVFVGEWVQSAAAGTGPRNEQDRQRAEEILQEARLAREAGDLEQARQLFNRALEMDPFNRSTYLGLHHLYERLGDFEASRDLLERAIVHLSREGSFYAELFQLLSKMGRGEDAQRILQVGLNACPGDVTLLSLLPAQVVVMDRSGKTLEVVDLGDRTDCVVGREDPVSGFHPGIGLEDPGVSRRHARIWRERNTYLVEDLGSTNGTFVNKERIAPGMLRVLEHGDRIRVGLTDLVFRRLPV